MTKEQKRLIDQYRQLGIYNAYHFRQSQSFSSRAALYNRVFGCNPAHIFSEGNENDSLLLQKIVDRLEKHSDDDLSMFLSLLERMDQPKS